MNRLILLFAFLFTSSFILNAQSRHIRRKHGACYAKCIVPDQYKTEKIQLPIFTGDEQSQVAVKKYVIKTAATSRWVRKASGKSCRTSDPDDNVVWCLVEKPEVVYEYIIVADTTNNPYYEMQTIEKKELVKVGGNAEWQEVVCRSGITPRLIRSIGQALKDKGYYVGIVPEEVTPELKLSMKEFIADNNLPMGNIFNYQVLGELGVVAKRSPEEKKAKRKSRKRRRRSKKTRMRKK